ncbi:MAG: hypothetical protein S4CHLAM45_08140 [Chlamydiales bacterium]|nr:hypothetical protein [Chlamydiales bacterium]MCH9620434.1 hypothetical protein [Chlamydiales bacterium]MCH9622920.1 hypothetical protein [Chlamydiales bacterium]
MVGFYRNGGSMRNKILIIAQNQADQEELEEILESVVKKGGELFFCQEREGALKLIELEQPQLVFVVGEANKAWKEVVFIQRPFVKDLILRRCHASLSTKTPPKVPPM